MTENKYDLEERTLKFSNDIIELVKNIGKNAVNSPLISQLIRSSTSIGANYREANGASSKKDFRNKIFICKKEAKETLYWLELIKKIDFKKDNILYLQKECLELTKIFSKICSSIKD